MAEEIRFDSELNDLLDRDPFVPFDIVTTSGDRYHIPDPGLIAFGSNVIIVALRSTGIQLVRKNQIVAVHVQEPSI